MEKQQNQLQQNATQEEQKEDQDNDTSDQDVNQDGQNEQDQTQQEQTENTQDANNLGAGTITVYAQNKDVSGFDKKEVSLEAITPKLSFLSWQQPEFFHRIPQF